MRNRFHSICPYFAMFPEAFVRKHLVWSRPGDLVLDPFSGRGTTALEALLSDRDVIAGDTNPVAICVSRAKADPPALERVLARLDDLEEQCRHEAPSKSDLLEDEFFTLCYAPATLRQVLFLRERLDWRRSRNDCMISALALGCLHGESHRSALCFSNRMPRTISTKPAYSVRWWRERQLTPPVRDVFEILREVARYRYQSPLPSRRGRVAAVDVRRIADQFPDAKSAVALVITSPPYLNTTNYREDQWLRVWFLGGAARPMGSNGPDDRHRGSASYWKFLTEAWAGIAPLLRSGAHVVVRIGGRDAQVGAVQEELGRSLQSGLGRSVRLRDRRSSDIRNSQVHAFRPGAKGLQVEHDLHYEVV